MFFILVEYPYVFHIQVSSLIYLHVSLITLFLCFLKNTWDVEANCNWFSFTPIWDFGILVEAKEKGAFGSPSTAVGKFDFWYLTTSMYNQPVYLPTSMYNQPVYLTYFFLPPNKSKMRVFYLSFGILINILT